MSVTLLVTVQGDAHIDDTSREITSFRPDLGKGKVLLSLPLPLFTRAFVEPETILRVVPRVMIRVAHGRRLGPRLRPLDLSRAPHLDFPLYLK